MLLDPVSQCNCNATAGNKPETYLTWLTIPIFGVRKSRKKAYFLIWKVILHIRNWCTMMVGTPLSESVEERRREEKRRRRDGNHKLCMAAPCGVGHGGSRRPSGAVAQLLPEHQLDNFGVYDL
jgi:hypothetical protein